MLTFYVVSPLAARGRARGSNSTLNLSLVTCNLYPVARFKLTLEYTGSRYSGWQKQVNARTVQGELERAIAEAIGHDEFECQGSGRTDAGVHALMQVTHLEIALNMPLEKFRRQINDELPHDIHVLTIEKAAHRFHARHAAIRRSYLYQVSRRRSAFAKPFAWWVKEPLDIDRMTKAAARFAGIHDFRSFSDDDPEDKSTSVQVESVMVAEADDLILIRVVGSHFLWKMVRRMVGVLVEIGKGALPVSAVDDFLARPSGTPARLTAPSAGLFLERVFYEADEVESPLRPAIPVRQPAQAAVMSARK
jgi:tRNA pseudouridine38-40 synthase